MAELIISFYVAGPHAAPVGQRIWDNGVAEAYRTSRRVKDATGEYVTEMCEPGWYRITVLNEDLISAVHEAISKLDIASIPERIDTVDDYRTDTSFADWHIRYQSQSESIHKTIHVAQWGPLQPEAAPLMPLLIKVNTIINTALTARP